MLYGVRACAVVCRCVCVCSLRGARENPKPQNPTTPIFRVCNDVLKVETGFKPKIDGEGEARAAFVHELWRFRRH